jgi:hypothetical protein
MPRGSGGATWSADSLSPLRVLICEEAGILAPSLFGDQKPQYVKTINCASFRDLKR